jgi:hypothetical protein
VLKQYERIGSEPEWFDEPRHTRDLASRPCLHIRSVVAARNHAVMQHYLRETARKRKVSQGNFIVLQHIAVHRTAAFGSLSEPF